ncbi:MAG: hypothetical protein FJY67_05110 [Calditrichaeota bacterium]|nr:hypothetical protein [Calditrichota bacterium]
MTIILIDKPASPRQHIDTRAFPSEFLDDLVQLADWNADWEAGIFEFIYRRDTLKRMGRQDFWWSEPSEDAEGEPDPDAARRYWNQHIQSILSLCGDARYIMIGDL